MNIKFFIIKKHWKKDRNIDKDIEILSDFDISIEGEEIRIGEIIAHNRKENGCEMVVGDGIIIRNKVNKLEVINNKLGFQSVYFYNNKNIGIISSNFWEILKNINDFSINEYETLSSIFTAKSKIFNDTFVNEIKLIPPGSKLILQNSGDFKIIQCFNLKYNGEINNENIAARELYESMDTWVKHILNKYNQKIVMVGISGGWDSRVIPHFILKYKNPEKVYGFIIGESRPRKLLVSFDHKIASEIASFYKINLSYFEFTKDYILKKVALDIYSNPLKTSNILKAVAVNNELSSNGILLGGGNGTIVGGHVINEMIYHMNVDEFLDFMLKKFTYIFYRHQGLRRKFESAIHYLTGKEYKYMLSYIVPKEWFEAFKGNLYEYVISNRPDKSFSELLMWYHLNIADKCGAFESLSNQIDAFSIYYPIAFEKTLNWDIDLLIDRKALRKMILNYMPKLAAIPGQNLSLPLTKKNNEFQILKQLFELLIRGIGLDYFRWAKWKEYRKLVKAVSEFRNEYFEDILRVKSSSLIKISNDPNISFWAKRNIVKFKIILDLIVSGNYKYIGGGDFVERLSYMYKLRKEV